MKSYESNHSPFGTKMSLRAAAAILAAVGSTTGCSVINPESSQHEIELNGKQLEKFNRAVKLGDIGLYALEFNKYDACLNSERWRRCKYPDTLRKGNAAVNAESFTFTMNQLLDDMSIVITPTSDSNETHVISTVNHEIEWSKFDTTVQFTNPDSEFFGNDQVASAGEMRKFYADPATVAVSGTYTFEDPALADNCEVSFELNDATLTIEADEACIDYSNIDTMTKSDLIERIGYTFS